MDKIRELGKHLMVRQALELSILSRRIVRVKNEMEATKDPARTNELHLALCQLMDALNEQSGVYN